MCKVCVLRVYTHHTHQYLYVAHDAKAPYLYVARDAKTPTFVVPPRRGGRTVNDFQADLARIVLWKTKVIL